MYLINRIALKSHYNTELRPRAHEAKEAKKASAAASNQRRRPKGVSRDDTGEVAVARQQVNIDRTAY